MIRNETKCNPRYIKKATCVALKNETGKTTSLFLTFHFSGSLELAGCQTKYQKVLF